jgi:prepilin peptidase CpaA
MPLALQVAFAAIVLLAAAEDGWRYRISNLFSIAMVGLFGAAAAAHGFQIDWLDHLAAGLLVFAVGAFMFARGWFGGGDVKFISAVSLVAGLGNLPILLVAIALCGGLVAILLSLVRLALPATNGPSSRLKLLSPRAPIPYGLAICGGSLFLMGELSLLGA